MPLVQFCEQFILQKICSLDVVTNIVLYCIFQARRERVLQLMGL